MPRTSCLADLRPDDVALFTTLLNKAGAPMLAVVAHLNVAEIGKLAPAVLVCDLDVLATDPLEMLRQLRFVLADSVIIVYTTSNRRAFGLAAHKAGANGVLSQGSTPDELARGLRASLRSGCFTDPRLAA
jgi:DNA-binding NarL/FixJ family response regulator